MANFRYRHYIYLDSDEILNVAAIIEGGEVSEEPRHLTRGFGGKYGGRQQVLVDTFDSDGNALSGRELPDKAARIRALIMGLLAWLSGA